MVTQETVLFDDTIAANIAFGAPRARARREIEAAARAAHAHDFIAALPDGYRDDASASAASGSRADSGSGWRLPGRC